MTGWINLDAVGRAGIPHPAPDARFEDAFRRWLVRALCFNVYPAAAADHAVELIGAADCDPAAADWALDEVWLPSRPSLALPDVVRDADDGVVVVRRLLREALADGFAGARLKRYPRIAVGHVDGALDVVWERAPI
jgi:hypothetical protein